MRVESLDFKAHVFYVFPKIDRVSRTGKLIGTCPDTIASLELMRCGRR